MNRPEDLIIFPHFWKDVEEAARIIAGIVKHSHDQPDNERVVALGTAVQDLLREGLHTVDDAILASGAIAANLGILAKAIAQGLREMDRELN